MIETSWDDGKIEDLRLVELLLKYNIPATFYLQNVGLELSLKQIREISKNFTIGAHTISHPEDLKKVPYLQLVDEIEYNKKWLEDITGKEINTFAYPGGRYNEKTIEILKMLKFKEARTTLVLNIEQPINKFRIAPTIHVKKIRKEYNKEKWLDVAKKLYIEALNKDNGYFHLWGHSYEINQENLWDELEEFFKFIKKYE